jgi:predicted NUDIX family phosphoesterase
MNILTKEEYESIRDSLLPTLECIYGSDGRYKPSISELNQLLPYKSEDILCVNNRVTISDIEKTIDIPFYRKALSRIYMINDRRLVERFSDKRQMVVGAVVHDQTNILLLNAINQKTVYRNHNLTMVLGHVSVGDEFNPSCTPADLLRINLAKELCEELSHNIYTQDKMFEYYLTESYVKYLGIVTSDDVPISAHHIMAVYDVEVSNVYNFISNEPDKHSVVVIPMNKLHTLYDKLDNLFLKTISKIDIIKEKYNAYLLRSYINSVRGYQYENRITY